MTCEHNMFCPGKGPEHDFFTYGGAQIHSARREGKAMSRSGNPARRAQGAHIQAWAKAALDFGKTVKQP